MESIYQKIINVMEAVTFINKDTKVNNQYKALSIENLLTQLRPELVKNKLIFHNVRFETNTKMELTSKGTTNEIWNVKGIYRLINAENPTEYIEVESLATGIDNQDKAAGKAMTYCMKYALINIFLIPSGEDLDRVSSKEISEKQGDRMSTYIPTKQEIEQALLSIATCESEAALTEIWKNNPKLKTNELYKKAVTEKGNELKGAK